MALSMKERYARLDMSKLPDDYSSKFKQMKEVTEDFTDDVIVETFEKNFSSLYELVESKFPDAIKKPGKIVKVKPDKVKVIRKKKTKEEKEEEKYQLPGKIEKELHGRLTEADIMFIEDQLVNNEVSSDEELVEHFMKEIPALTEAKAKKWVSFRDKYLSQKVEDSLDYPTRTKMKKQARKDKNVVKTRDGHSFDRTDPALRGVKFYDENGKQWKCKRYDKTLDECIMADSDGKEISCCLKDMYVNNPVEKRKKGNLVDECKETLKEAGYMVKEHQVGKKKIKRRAPRPEKQIIKERVEETFVPITKDLESSEEKKTENKEILSVLKKIESKLVKLVNRLSNIADDGKVDKLEKLNDLLDELLGE